MACDPQKAIIGFNCVVGLVVASTPTPLLGYSAFGLTRSTDSDSDKVAADLGKPNRIPTGKDFSFSFDGQVFQQDPAYEEAKTRWAALSLGEYYIEYTWPDGATTTYTGCFDVAIDENGSEGSRLLFTMSMNGSGDLAEVYVPA